MALPIVVTVGPRSLTRLSNCSIVMSYSLVYNFLNRSQTPMATYSHGYEECLKRATVTRSLLTQWLASTSSPGSASARRAPSSTSPPARNRTSKATAVLRRRELDKARMATFRARERMCDGVPKRIAEHEKKAAELIKAAKGGV